MTRGHAPFAPTIAHRRPWRLLVAASLLALGASHVDARSSPDSLDIASVDVGTAPAKPKEIRVWMTVGDHRFAVTLADTDAARAFAARLPLTLDLSELNGNEKKVDLAEALPANASRPGTIRTGDLMLYGTSTLVVFYRTFDSSYSYTRLGRVEDTSRLVQALGPHSARIEFSRP